MNKKIGAIWAGIFAVALSAVSGIFVWWINGNLNRPEIDWYSRPYYKIDDMAIGNIYLWNSGRTTDHNIAITLDANLMDQNIKVVDLVSSYKIQHNDNKTTIIIDSLKPEEAADITFKDDPSKDDVEIDNFISDSSNIVNIPMAEKHEWWYLPWWAEIIIFTGLFSAGGASLLLIKSKCKFTKLYKK